MTDQPPPPESPQTPGSTASTALRELSVHGDDRRGSDARQDHRSAATGGGDR